jgi:hypothetical protein
MNASPQVVIVTCRCSRSRQGFGIRFEEVQPCQWVADWAFAVPDTTASKEGYDRNGIAGAFSLANAYPGCPHCRTRSIFRCGCGKVGCWDGVSYVICPWCGARGEVRGSIECLGGGSDR